MRSLTAPAIELREGGARDVDALVSLSLACSRARRAWAGHAWMPSAVSIERQLWSWRIQDRTGRVALATAGPTAVGSVAAWPAREDGRLAYIAGPFVDPEWWGEGLGSRLHDVAASLLAQLGFARAEIAVEAGNRRARSFFAGRGWREGGGEGAPSPLALVRYVLTL